MSGHCTGFDKFHQGSYPGFEVLEITLAFYFAFLAAKILKNNHRMLRLFRFMTDALNCQRENRSMHDDEEEK